MFISIFLWMIILIISMGCKGKMEENVPEKYFWCKMRFLCCELAVLEQCFKRDNLSHGGEELFDGSEGTTRWSCTGDCALCDLALVNFYKETLASQKKKRWEQMHLTNIPLLSNLNLNFTVHIGCNKKN